MAEIDKRIPKVGKRFRDSDEAWEFWVEYGGHIGFDVRKRCTNLSKCDGKVTSCRFVCSNEGIRRKSQTDRAQLRYKDLSHKFHNIAHKAANSSECCVLLESALDSVAPNIEELLNASTSATAKPCKDKENVDPKVQQIDELLSSARLKKKEVQPSNLRRKKTWLDKLLKRKRKPTKATAPTKKGAKHQKKKEGEVPNKKDGVKPQVQEKHEKNKGADLELQEWNGIISFTQQLLLAPPCDGVGLF